MRRIISILVALLVMMSSVSFATTAPKTTFSSTAEINGVWLKTDSVYGYAINGNEISLVKREKGTAKLTYIKDTESKSKPTLSKDKKSITFKIYEKDSSVAYTVKKDTKGITVWYLGKQAVSLKHFKSKVAVDQYFKADKNALALIKREADYLKELKDYTWLIPGNNDYNIKTPEIEEAMSIYGSGDNTVLKGEKLLVGGSSMFYCKEHMADGTDWCLIVWSDEIEISFYTANDKILAITTDALELLYPASAKIDDVSKKIVADIKTTKRKDQFGIFYALSSLHGKTQTINGIQFSYVSNDGPSLNVLIKK